MRSTKTRSSTLEPDINPIIPDPAAQSLMHRNQTTRRPLPRAARVVRILERRCGLNAEPAQRLHRHCVEPLARDRAPLGCSRLGHKAPAHSDQATLSQTLGCRLAEGSCRKSWSLGSHMAFPRSRRSPVPARAERAIASLAPAGVRRDTQRTGILEKSCVRTLDHSSVRGLLRIFLLGSARSAVRSSDNPDHPHVRSCARGVVTVTAYPVVRKTQRGPGRS